MREDVAWRHELWQPADPRSPARVRAFVAEHLLAHGRAHLVEPVRLVASELATNAILHSGTEFTVTLLEEHGTVMLDRKSTRLNSSHANISYAVFCLKKKNKICTGLYP